MGSTSLNKSIELPDEILHIIVSHLNQLDTCKFCLINKQCYEIGKQKLQKNLFIGSRRWEFPSSSFKFYNTYTVVEFDVFFKLLWKKYWNSGYLKRIVFMQQSVGPRFYKDFRKDYPITEIISDCRTSLIANLNSTIPGVTSLQINFDNKIDFCVNSIYNLEIDLLNQTCENLPHLLSKFRNLNILSLKNCTEFSPNSNVILKIPNLVIDGIITEPILKLFAWENVKGLHFQSSRDHDSFKKRLENIEKISIDCSKELVQHDFFIGIPSEKLRFVFLKGRHFELRDVEVIKDIEGIQYLVLQKNNNIFWLNSTGTFIGDYTGMKYCSTCWEQKDFSRYFKNSCAHYRHPESSYDFMIKPIIESLHSQYNFPDLIFIYAYQKVFKIEKFYGEFVDCEENLIEIKPKSTA